MMNMIGSSEAAQKIGVEIRRMENILLSKVYASNEV